MSKKKILIFSTLPFYPYWGGSEMLWYNFVSDERVRREVHSELMLADSHVTREKGKFLETLGVSANFYTPYTARFTLRNIVKTAEKLGFYESNYGFWYKSILSLSPDLVWFNVAKVEDYVKLSYATNLCQKQNIPYWLVLQGAPEFYFDGDELSDQIFRNVIEKAKRNIYQSEKNHLCIDKAVGKRLTNYFVSRNGLTTEFLNKASQVSKINPVRTEGKLRILFLARVQPNVKGHHLVLEVLSSPRWKDRDWEINFVGGGEIFLLERLIKYYEINREKVKITGDVSDVFSVIGNSDLLVMPSIFEGTPLTVIESMACGRPVVGTSAGAMPEVIINEKTGWLARTASVNDLSESLEKAWASRKNWVKIGNNGRELINEEYNQTHYIPRLLETLISDTNK